MQQYLQFYVCLKNQGSKDFFCKQRKIWNMSNILSDISFQQMTQINPVY